MLELRCANMQNRPTKLQLVPSMIHLNKADYTVATVSLVTAQRLIAAHHYAKGSANTATFRHGLFARANPDICLGVACWLPPTKSAAVASWDGDWRRVLSLSRLVIVPEMPTNAASYLLGRSIRLIRQDGRFLCLVTYADEWQGHTGAIYKATNWEYVGLTGEEPIYASGDGRMTARLVRLVVIVERNTSLPSFAPLLQASVIQFASNVELVLHSRNLRFGRVEPVLKGLHMSNLAVEEVS